MFEIRLIKDNGILSENAKESENIIGARVISEEDNHIKVTSYYIGNEISYEDFIKEPEFYFPKNAQMVLELIQRYEKNRIYISYDGRFGILQDNDVVVSSLLELKMIINEKYHNREESFMHDNASTISSR